MVTAGRVFRDGGISAVGALTERKLKRQTTVEPETLPRIVTLPFRNENLRFEIHNQTERYRVLDYGEEKDFLLQSTGWPATERCSL